MEIMLNFHRTCILTKQCDCVLCFNTVKNMFGFDDNGNLCSYDGVGGVYVCVFLTPCL